MKGKGTMRIILAAIAFGMLAGCYTTPVVMVKPDTGRTVECGPYYTGLDGGIGKGIPARESQCIQDYKEQGYVRQ